MSSTTSGLQGIRRSRRRGQESGQILVIFAGGLIAFLAVAALVFDVGQDLFDWRAQRDAADAGALAGARYVISAPNYTGPCPPVVSGNDAVDAACVIAHANGYGDLNGDGTDDRGHVDVHIPPVQGPYANEAGFIEVDIHTDRPSFFAAVLGVLRQNVNALAVAGNQPGIAPPYSLLALNPTCTPNPSGQVGGNGSVDVEGPVYVDSNCPDAMLFNGNGSITAPDCSVVSNEKQTPGATVNCPVTNGAAFVPDPLAGLPPPPKPADPPAKVTVLLWNGGGPVTQAIPTGCPGSTAIEVVTDGNLQPSTAFASGASVALPFFEPGNLAIVHAYRNNSDTPPTRPAGWTSILSGGGNGNSGTVGYRFLRNGDTSTGTWTNATAIQVIILDGAAASPIGASARLDSSTSTLTTPALSLVVTNQTSWVVAFAGSKGTDANTVDLSGTTTRSGSVGALALHTGQGVSTWSSQNYSSTVNAAGNWTAAVEVKAALPSTATATNPIGCTFTGGSGGSYNVYRIHPGVYYGGIKLNGAVRVYMAPGTYWLAGGGLSMGGTGAQLISDSGGSGFVWPSNVPAPGRGVLIYNTEDAGYCGVLPGACIGAINANGGSDNSCTNQTTKWRTPAYPTTDPTLKCAWVHLEPNDSPYKNLLIFVDRNLTADIFFNGDTGIIELFGTVYNPKGDVKINGSAGDTVAVQVIAYTFHITGNGGFTVTYDAGGLFQLKGVGLVQ